MITFIRQFIIYDGKVYEDIGKATEGFIIIKNSIGIDMHLSLEQRAKNDRTSSLLILVNYPKEKGA